MKTLKTVFVVLIAIAFILPVLGTSQAQAAGGWFTCYVTQAGPQGATFMVRLSDNAATPAFTNTWYIFYNTNTNFYAATALSALASGLKVQVYVTDTAQYSTITSLFLLNQ
jgi:hypothetical protein